jgi:hypothetical protein
LLLQIEDGSVWRVARSPLWAWLFASLSTFHLLERQHIQMLSLQSGLVGHVMQYCGPIDSTRLGMLSRSHTPMVLRQQQPMCLALTAHLIARIFCTEDANDSAGYLTRDVSDSFEKLERCLGFEMNKMHDLSQVFELLDLIRLFDLAFKGNISESSELFLSDNSPASSIELFLTNPQVFPIRPLQRSYLMKFRNTLKAGPQTWEHLCYVLGTMICYYCGRLVRKSVCPGLAFGCCKDCGRGILLPQLVTLPTATKKFALTEAQTNQLTKVRASLQRHFC